MNEPRVTVERGAARCPYEDCGRTIGSPLALVDGPQVWGPWRITCPECGRYIKLKRHRELVETFQAQEMDMHWQDDEPS